jgi:flagellar capping protein FliD
MPSVYFHTNDAGIDIEDTIKKLMEVEREPIKRYQEIIHNNNQKVKAWKTIKKDCKDLQEAIRKLYGFRAPFNRRSLESGIPGAVSGTVKNGAKVDERKLEILSLASKHKIASDLFNPQTQIKPGSFSIQAGEQEITHNWKGGSAEKLASEIQDTFSEILKTFTNKIDADNHRLILESRIEGEKGRIIFNDQNGILSDLGLLKNVDETVEIKELLFEKPLMESYQPEVLSGPNSEWNLLSNGLKLKMNGPLGKRFIVPGKKSLPPNTKIYLKWFVDLSSDKEEKVVKPVKKATKADDKKDLKEFIDKDKSPDKISVGPREKIIINGIELEGYDVDRFRQKAKLEEEKKIETEQPKKEPVKTETPAFSLILAGKKNVSSKELEIHNSATSKDGAVQYDDPIWGKVKCDTAIKPEGGLIECTFLGLNQGNVPQGDIIFAVNSDKKVLFYRPILKIPKKGGKHQPKNVLTDAENARFKLDGVEMERPQNKNLKDVIDGVSLNLNQTTSGPFTVKINAQIEDAKKYILTFIEMYNKFLRNGRKFGKAAQGVGLGDSRKRKLESGILIGDSTLRRLLFVVQNSVNRAYPSKTAPHYRILPAIGISTGKIGTPWKDIKAGLLVVDEEKLNDALTNGSLSVKELFNSDNNGDGRLDDGVAFQLISNLKPYTRSVGGLLVIRIDSLNDQIDDTHKRIDKHEEYLVNYEMKTRQKFKAMESAIKKSKSVSDYLKNYNPNRQKEK